MSLGLHGETYMSDTPHCLDKTDQNILWTYPKKGNATWKISHIRSYISFLDASKVMAERKENKLKDD